MKMQVTRPKQDTSKLLSNHDLFHLVLLRPWLPVLCLPGCRHHNCKVHPAWYVFAANTKHFCFTLKHTVSACLLAFLSLFAPTNWCTPSSTQASSQGEIEKNQLLAFLSTADFVVWYTPKYLHLSPTQTARTRALAHSYLFCCESFLLGRRRWRKGRPLCVNPGKPSTKLSPLHMLLSPWKISVVTTRRGRRKRASR